MATNIIRALLPADPSSDDIPTDYWPAIWAGWAIVVLTFAALSAWSSWAPLSTAAIAQGTVVVDGNRKSIQHLEGGIVKQILVRDGDPVEAGQLLVRLDDTQPRAMLALLRGRHDAARAQEARLLAERDGAVAIAFPADLAERAAAERDAADIVDGQKQLFTARRLSISGQVSILESRIEQSKAQISGLEVQQSAKQRQIGIVHRQLTTLRELAGKGAASAHQVLEFEREMSRLDGERGQLIAQIAATQHAIGEAELQIIQLQKAFREDVEKQLGETQAQLLDLNERIRSARDQVERIEIVAPTSGTVVDLAVFTIGGVIAPGSRVLDIVPRNDQLVIEAQVRPDDIDGLRPGLMADVRFSAFNRGTTPSLKGTVATVSADRLVNPKTNTSYFVARILVDDDQRAQLKGLSLIPGMPADVIIAKGDRTLFDYIAAPIENVVVKSLRQ